MACKIERHGSLFLNSYDRIPPANWKLLLCLGLYWLKKHSHNVLSKQPRFFTLRRFFATPNLSDCFHFRWPLYTFFISYSAVQILYQFTYGKMFHGGKRLVVLNNFGNAWSFFFFSVLIWKKLDNHFEWICSYENKR